MKGTKEDIRVHYYMISIMCRFGILDGAPWRSFVIDRGYFVSGMRELRYVKTKRAL